MNPLVSYACVPMLLATAPLYASERGWEFDVYLDKKPIGSHSFSLAEGQDQTVLQTTASFDVKVLFINAFRYRHSNTEVWDRNCLAAIDAVTDNNGQQLSVKGEADGSVFEVSGQFGTSELDGCVQTFAYWNPAILDATRLLNSQTGEYESVSAKLEGDDLVRVGDSFVDADRYRLTAKGGDIFLWYTKDDARWVALDAPAKGKRRIRYEARSVPQSTLNMQASTGAF